MEHLVDLGAVHAELDSRRPAWTRRGMVVHESTWRDGSGPLPRLVTDRALVGGSDSLGVTFKTTSGSDGSLVLWAGGWADLDALIDGRIVSETPEFVDVQSCIAVAEALVERLLHTMTT